MPGFPVADLAGRGPPGQKTGKAPKVDRRKRDGKEDLAYLEKIRECPCIVCAIHGEPQATPTTAHHTKDGRGSQTKTGDREAIPLCDCHHQGQLANSKVAIHREPAKWAELYGRDIDYLEATKKMLEGG